METRHAAARFEGRISQNRQNLANSMARKRKKRTFSAVTAVREMARERVGSPKPSRLVVGKKAKAEKHKTTLSKLLVDD